MITKEVSQTVNENVTVVRVTVHQDEYHDEKGVQELVSQMKQYADNALGGD